MGKRAELFTQLQIDEAILDYLLYTATKALLDKGKSAQFDENTSAPQDAAELTMQMVNCMLLLSSSSCRIVNISIAFLDMFHSMHPEYCGGPDLQLRLRLLKFVSLFTSRFLTARLSSAPLLLDTLPGFMALCANSYMNFPTTDLSEVFMKLAADYMVQAAAEEILKSGGTDAGIHRQAFAYGFDNESTADEGSDEFKINAMFFGDDGQLDGWEKIRESHIRAVSSFGVYAFYSH